MDGAEECQRRPGVLSHGGGGRGGFSADAASTAEWLLAPLGRRWAHVQAVAVRACELAGAVGVRGATTLVQAAWLHDVGYAPTLADTNFHPLDGARYLRDEGWPSSIVNLVAHHSGSRFEAVMRGLSAELAEFPLPDGPILDALVTADLTTGPSGERVTFDQRIGEILHRYPAGHPVHEAWLTARSTIKHSVYRTEARLAAGSAQVRLDTGDV